MEVTKNIWKNSTVRRNWPLCSELREIQTFKPRKGRPLKELVMTFSDGVKVRVSGQFSVKFAD